MNELLSPARDEERLLQPIPGDNPSGVHLRHEGTHAFTYDQIRRTVAAADATGGADAGKALAKVVVLASDLLADESKDIDIAVWLCAALAWTRALPGTLEGLKVLTQLVDRYWDTIYPLPEEGDEGLRGGPLERICRLLVRPLLAIPVVPGGAYSVQDYLSSRGEGPPAAEDVDRAVNAAARQFYEVTLDALAQCRQQLNALQQVCNTLFNSLDDRPSFQALFHTLDRIGGIFESILQTKPDPVAELPTPPSAPAHLAKEPARAVVRATTVATTVAITVDKGKNPAPSRAIAGHSPEESVTLAAAALFNEDHTDPVPYLVMRSLRFGKLIGADSPVPPELLEAPTAELRTALRRAFLAADWDELLRQAEEGIRSPCGGSWLDLQFLAYRACRELGLDRPAEAIRGALAGYLRVLPDLPAATLVDGTPTCGADTLQWLQAEVLPDPQQAQIESLAGSNAKFSGEGATHDTASPDVFDEAAAKFAAGDFPAAFGILSLAWSREACGKGRIQRRIQQAQMALEAKRFRLALPLLREVFRVIEERRLESWEPPEWVGHPLAMLCRCLDQLNEEPAERRRAYERLCAVDPIRALELDSV